MFISKFDKIYRQIIAESNLYLEEDNKLVSDEEAEEIVSYINGIEPNNKKSVTTQIKEIYRYIKSNNLVGKKFSESNWTGTVEPAIDNLEKDSLKSLVKKRLRGFMKIKGEFFEVSADDSGEEDTEKDSKNLLLSDDLESFKKMTENPKFIKISAKAANGSKKARKKVEDKFLEQFDNKVIDKSFAENLASILEMEKIVKDKDEVKTLFKDHNIKVKDEVPKKEEKIMSRFNEVLKTSLAKVEDKAEQTKKDNKDNSDINPKSDAEHDENLNGLTFEKARERIYQLQKENNWKKNKDELNKLGIDLDDVDEYQDRMKELAMKAKKYHGENNQIDSVHIDNNNSNDNVKVNAKNTRVADTDF